MFPVSRDVDVTAYDADLFARLKSGDGAAHDALLRRYGSALIRHAARFVGSLDRSQEIVQDVFLWLWDNRATLDATYDVAPYLFWLTRTRALNASAADSASAQRDGAWGMARAIEGDDPLDTADAALELDDLRATVWSALSTAPPRCREVFWLVWGEQRSYTEVATMLNISILTVRNQMSRALKRLSQTLGVGHDFG